MSETIHKIKFAKEFKICPKCGYEDGFHTMLKQDGKNIKWMFICPTCHTIFDIGYKIPEGMGH